MKNIYGVKVCIKIVHKCVCHSNKRSLVQAYTFMCMHVYAFTTLKEMNMGEPTQQSAVRVFRRVGRWFEK